MLEGDGDPVPEGTVPVPEGEPVAVIVTVEVEVGVVDPLETDDAVPVGATEPLVTGPGALELEDPGAEDEAGGGAAEELTTPVLVDGEG